MNTPNLPKLRPCVVLKKYRDPEMKEWRTVEAPGYFHQWAQGVDYPDGKTAEVVTLAIVEDKEGRVELWPVEQVRFEDRKGSAPAADRTEPPYSNTQPQGGPNAPTT